MVKGKKQSKDDISQKKLDMLAKALENESPERLRTLLKADSRLNLRLSEIEKQEIEQTAKSMNMTVTSYLLAIHRISRDILVSKRIIQG